jgi:hypothetical protein
MLCQLDKNRVGAIAGMNGDIGVDKVSQDRATPSIPPSQRNLDRLPLFDARGLWHAAQGGNRILQTVARGDNCDDVTEACDFKIDVGIRIGQLGRNANSLAIAGFENTGPWHRSLVPRSSELMALEDPAGDEHANPCIYKGENPTAACRNRRAEAAVAGEHHAPRPG